MNLKEKLMEEYQAAVIAVYGDLADEEFENVSEEDLNAINEKVKFYMGVK